MRALTIFEIQNFQRGGDPLSTMGISMRSISLEIIGAKYAGSCNNVPPEKLKYILKNIQNYMFAIIFEFSNPKFDTSYYTPFYIMHNYSNEFKYYFWDGDYYNITGNKIQIEESINFERGGDPLDSLNIGRNFKYKKLAEDFYYQFRSFNPNCEYLKKKINKIILESGFINYNAIKSIKEFFGNNKYFSYINTTNKKSIATGRTYYIITFEEKKQVSESQQFQRGGDPLDSLNIGRIKERKDRAKNAFLRWLDNYIYDSKDVVRKCYINKKEYIGDDKKEYLIFGKPIYDIEQIPFIFLHNEIAEKCFNLEYWPIVIKELINPRMSEEEEDELEDTYDDYRFLDNMVKYFIDKWPGIVPKEIQSSLALCKKCGNKFDYLFTSEAGMGYVRCPKCKNPVTQKDMIRESINFQRGGDPLKTMGIGMEEYIKQWMISIGRSFETVRGDDPWERALSLSSRYNKKDFVEYLLNKKIDPNGYDNWPLYSAVSSGHYEVTKLLLEAGADPFDKVYKLSVKDLVENMEYAFSDVKELVMEYINKGKLKESYNFIRGGDPLVYLNIGMEAKLKEFLDEKEYNNSNEDDILIFCSSYGKSNLVEYLLNKGLNVNGNNGDPLRSACIFGGYDVVKILLNYGADPNIEKGAPLNNAIVNEYPNIVKLLLKRGADPKIGDAMSYAKLKENPFYKNLIKKYSK